MHGTFDAHDSHLSLLAVEDGRPAPSAPEPPSLGAATVARLQPALVAYARRRVSSTEVAEDLVQETWVAAMHALPSFSGRSSLKTWLTAILRRKIADSYRSRRPQVSFLEGHHGTASSADAIPRAVEARRQAETLELALQKLTPREREAVELCGLEDLEREEAASRMGLSRPCLRVTLCRGRKHLRAVLEGPLSKAA